VCIVVSCLVCMVVVVLCELLSSYVYLVYYVCIVVRCLGYCCNCLVCIVVAVLCVLLQLSCVYCC